MLGNVIDLVLDNVIDFVLGNVIDLVVGNVIDLVLGNIIDMVLGNVIDMVLSSVGKLEGNHAWCLGHSLKSTIDELAKTVTPSGEVITSN